MEDFSKNQLTSLIEQPGIDDSFTVFSFDDTYNDFFDLDLDSIFNPSPTQSSLLEVKSLSPISNFFTNEKTTYTEVLPTKKIKKELYNQDRLCNQQEKSTGIVNNFPSTSIGDEKQGCNFYQQSVNETHLGIPTSFITPPVTPDEDFLNGTSLVACPTLNNQNSMLSSQLQKTDCGPKVNNQFMCETAIKQEKDNFLYQKRGLLLNQSAIQNKKKELMQSNFSCRVQIPNYNIQRLDYQPTFIQVSFF